jgi:hypothetical protein
MVAPIACDGANDENPEPIADGQSGAGGEAGASGEGGRPDRDVLRPEDRPFSEALFASLKVPEGFELNVFAADMGHARMLAVHSGYVYLTRPEQGDGPDDLLYISVGSSCDACAETNPEHATLLQSSLDGSNRQIFAKGLRNTIGFAWNPDALWGMDRCSGFRKEAYCAQTLPPELLNQAHQSPLQLAFYTERAFPEPYRSGAFLALRGAWNREPATGYAIGFIRFEEGEPVSIGDDGRRPPLHRRHQRHDLSSQLRGLTQNSDCNA